MKVILRLSIPHKILFEQSQWVLGDRNGEYAVVDDDLFPYYMGSHEDCEEFME
jgi:hypothetical protein